MERNADAERFRHLEERAERNAEAERFGVLTRDHWKVIRFFLEYHSEHGTCPLPVRIGRATGFGAYRLHDLFPDGVVQTVCRLLDLDLPPDLRSMQRRRFWN